jgi:predicted nucleic acid-binding protein
MLAPVPVAATHKSHDTIVRVAKVYLETSFFSACASTRNDVDSQSWKGRSLSWLKTQAPRHQLYISAEVIAELSAPGYVNRETALQFTAGIELAPLTNEVVSLAQLLVDQRVMPGPLRGDAIHLAIAAYYGIEYLLSWNVKHLANPNKRVHLAQVLARAGKAPPLVVTPDVLWEDQ